MNRRGRTECNEVTRIRVRLRPRIHKIDIHLSEKIVFLLFAWWKEKLLTDRDTVGGVLAFNGAIGFARQRELVQFWRVWLVDHCANRRLIFGIDNDAVALADVIEQHRFGDAAATIG